MNSAVPDLKSLFGRAAEIPSGPQRAAYLDQACGGNAGLRAEMDGLLQASDQAGSFMHLPAPTSAANGAKPAAEGPGTRIGSYKLLQQIGEGGMGIVYMAEQQEPVHRKVALKIIKPGMDSRQVIARFEAERQALAMMDHQNIAKVLDAGTTESGRPYFVMELVHGLPITKYCDDHHLTPRERLNLFLPVCNAVQHAHQKGIIHRDLKPSNILVTMYDDKPVPKVIDFGVAKAVEQRLTEKTLFTQFGTLVGTFEYMSPEQAEMNAFGVDTRSDIYSLGVLLYELLTGSTPLERRRLGEAAYADIVRLIKEEEPPRPSTRLSSSGEALAGISQQRGSPPKDLAKLVRGELDWIVMRCLEKDRTRRYETASSLARDLERYLRDEQVEACPPTAMYRFQKFARKHKPAIFTAAAIAVCLLLGTTVSAWQAVRATTAEAQANANEQKASANAARAEEKAQEATEQRDEAQRQRDEVRALNEELQATQGELRRTLYAAHMNLAQHAWDAGAASRVIDLLNQHRPQADQPDYRGFEWRYLDRLGHSELLTFKGHTKVVWSVAFSPDGKRVASASWDGTVKVWDAETGREYLSLPGRTDPWNRIARVAFTSTGRRLAGAGPEQTVKVWDAESGTELLSVKSSGQVAGISFSSDGKRLAHAAGEDVQVWDANNGEALFTLKGHTTLVGGVAFSPDGRQIASASRTHAGQSIAGQVRIWDASTGQELFNLPGPGASWDAPIVFSADGRQLASPAKGGAIRIWDPKTGVELKSLPSRGEGRVLGLAFTPDGKRLAVSTFDGFVRVWDVEQGEQIFMLKGISAPGATSQDVAFSPDGSKIAVTGRLQVKLLDARSPQEFRAIQEAKATTSFPPRLTAVFSADGKRLFGVAGTDLKVWDVQSRKELLTFKGHESPIHSVAISRDGKWLASGAGEAEIKIWDASSGEERQTLKANSRALVIGLAFSPDSRQLAAAYSRGHYVKVWDPIGGTELRTMRHADSEGYVDGLDFSPDGSRIVTASYHTGTLKIWEAADGRQVLELKTKQYAGSALDVTFSPDGKRLASVHGSSAIRIWDAQTGEESMQLKGHASHVNCVTFSPDGKRLASGSGDRTVKVWDTQTGDELLSLSGHPVMLAGVAFSPDGKMLATTGQDETIRLWDATPVYEVAQPNEKTP